MSKSGLNEQKIHDNFYMFFPSSSSLKYILSVITGQMKHSTPASAASEVFSKKNKQSFKSSIFRLHQHENCLVSSQLYNIKSSILPFWVLKNWCRSQIFNHHQREKNKSETPNLDPSTSNNKAVSAKTSRNLVDGNLKNPPEKGAKTLNNGRFHLPTSTGDAVDG